MLDTAPASVKPAITARPRIVRVVIVALIVATPLVLLTSIGIGQLSATPGETLVVIWHRLFGVPMDSMLDTVVWQLRAPRVLLGFLVGAILASSGAALQAIVRNDLADPYLLGVSSGASLGAAVVLALGAAAGGALSGTVGAFVGAMGSLLLILSLVGRRELSSSRLVLAGLTVGYFLTAATNLVVVLTDNRDAIRAITFWMLGSLGKASWADLPLVACFGIAAIAIFTVWGRRLDAIGLGDDAARSLGTDPHRLRRAVAVIAALGIAAAVAVSGAIGFVGLVVPHLARGMVGATHRALIPVSALTGGVLLVAADALTRTVLAPRGIPLGILTALVGTPLLMSIIRRAKHERI